MRSGVTLLLDRDGTLIHDVPYNNDAKHLVLVDGARESLARIRARGIPIAIVTNQSAIARGMATPQQVDEFHQTLSQRVGGIDAFAVCPHVEGCDCRKPAPGLLLQALSLLGNGHSQAVLVGDIGSDVEAAAAAGIKSILVPNEKTRDEEIQAAPIVRDSFVDAMAAVCAFYDTGRLS